MGTVAAAKILILAGVGETIEADNSFLQVLGIHANLVRKGG